MERLKMHSCSKYWAKSKEFFAAQTYQTEN